jgi:hypothetical protein
MSAIKRLLILTLCLVATNCRAGKEMKEADELDKKSLEMANAILKSPENPVEKKVSGIDLSKIGHIASQGRVQDREYNRLEIIDQLMMNPRESVPYLIGKLDDETEINGPVMDFWPRVTVGDVALVILTDFMTNPAGKVNPGFSWEELFDAKRDLKISAEQYLRHQLARHSRRWLKQRWEATWAIYRDRLIWVEQYRSFLLV